VSSYLWTEEIKMNRKIYTFILLAVLALPTGCSPAEEQPSTITSTAAAATNTPTPHSTTEPQHTPTPAPDEQAATVEPEGPPEAIAMGEEALSLVDDNWYASDDGSFHVIGLIQNNHDSAVDMVEAEVTLYSADGNPLASESFASDLTVLQPDQVSPFQVSFYDQVPTDWDSYEITLTGREWDGLFQVYSDFAVLGHTWETDTTFGGLSIAGVVQNTGDTAAETIIMPVALYDAAGKLIGVGGGGAHAGTLAAGETGEFTCNVWEWAGEEWARYEFFFESYPAQSY